MSDRVANSAVQIGRGIRKLRKQRRWKQDVLAEESGLSRVTISLAENAKTNLSLYDLERIANAFDTDVSGLISAGRYSLRISDNTLKSLVAKNIIERRNYLGISRQQAAIRVSLLPQYFSTTENAKRLPSLINLQKIAISLETRLSGLLSSSYNPCHSEDGTLEYFDLNSLPSRLRFVRQSQSMSRQDVARSSGLDVNHIARFEDGKTMPTAQTIFHLCKGLGITIESLLE